MADGSVGWTVMIGCLTPIVFGHLLSKHGSTLSTRTAPMSSWPARSTRPARPHRSTGGYKVSGEMVVRKRLPALLTGSSLTASSTTVGSPPMQMMVLHPEDVAIVDTWSVSGLCGTGSHDFVADDVFVPAARTLLPVRRAEPRHRVAAHPRAVLLLARDRYGRHRHRPRRLERHRDAGRRQRYRLSGSSRWRPTRCSNISSPKPTPGCAPPDRCVNDDAGARLGDRCRGDVRSAPSTGPGSGPRRRGRRRSPRRSSTWPTRQAAAARSTRRARCSAASRDIHTLTQHFIVKHDTLTNGRRRARRPRDRHHLPVMSRSERTVQPAQRRLQTDWRIHATHRDQGLRGRVHRR